jgi:hypothetical protein
MTKLRALVHVGGSRGRWIEHRDFIVEYRLRSNETGREKAPVSGHSLTGRGKTYALCQGTTLVVP